MDRMKNADLNEKKVDNFNNKKIIIYYNHGKWYTREYDGTTKVS